MKLYGSTMSICTRKVMMALNEKNKEVQFIPVDLAKGEQKSADHMKRHPFGVVPVLEDDGFSLLESRAIIRYINDKFSDSPLVPTSLQDKARMEQWLSMEYSYFSPSAFKIFFNKVLAERKGLTVDQAAIAKGVQDTGKFLDVMNEHLKGRSYLAGETFSLADIVYMPLTDYIMKLGHADLIQSRPFVSAWWSRISSRPSWKKVVG